MTEQPDHQPFGPLRIKRVAWRDLAVSLGPVLLLSGLAIWIAVHFVRPAPPRTIVITSGPEGSVNHTNAERYRKILARNGITVEVLSSEGSLENLKRLVDPTSRVDVGFVQGGLSTAMDTTGVVSLGSVFYVPVVVFYRAAKPMDRLSELKGRRIAIGTEGSGTRFLALALLKANAIEPTGPTQLLALGGDAAMQALLAHKIDAAFLTGDSASPANIRALLRTRGIRLFTFPQADAYVRRFRYLTKLDVPPGAFDLGSNIPSQKLELLAPTVELVAKPNLHPALSDLLIEAAREVHGRATLLQRAGEFPAPLEHEYRLSDDASRYYKSGKSFVYRHLPFWLASLVDRTLVLLVPIVVVLIPGLRLVPLIYGWRTKTRIYRAYGELMALERAALSSPGPEERAELLKRLEQIDRGVISVKMPGSVADQLYMLRRHILWVRERLATNEPGPSDIAL